MVKSDKEIMQFLNSISNSFCAAKWNNATIWLGSGMTTSCHHPPAHKIDVEEVKQNPKALHNTPQKKIDRDQMQKGIRPPGCEYCWKIEDADSSNISDRAYKSKIYPLENVAKLAKIPVNQDVDLKTLEIAFDRTCNFACSYCNPAFSTTWVKDIKTNGAYQDLVSDGRNHFTHAHDSAQLYKIDEENPYVEAFFEWWESDLQYTLDELRITGGEPLASHHTWRLIDYIKQNGVGNPNMRFAVNSNLCVKPKLIDNLLDATNHIPRFHVYTSCEAMGHQAEYIRDGLDFEQFKTNLEKLDKSQVETIHMMCTVNALCLESLTNFLDYLLDFKNQSHRQKDAVVFTLNILRFPSFQSPLVLPKETKQKHINTLGVWLERNQQNELLHEMEKNHVARLIQYLKQVEKPHSETFEMDKLRNDFKKFYQQYDVRRNKDFANTFPGLRDWYNTI